MKQHDAHLSKKYKSAIDTEGKLHLRSTIQDGRKLVIKPFREEKMRLSADKEVLHDYIS